MSQRPSLAAFAILAAAAALPAHALIPLASDVVQGVLDSRKSSAEQDFSTPGVAPDPDPLEKYRGLSIKPTANDLAAHEAWVRRQAALSEAPDTLLERLSDAKSAGSAGLGLAVKGGPARLSQGQFYAYNANGSAQLYSGATAIKTSAVGLRALYQTLSEQDRQLAARGGLATAAAKTGDESSDDRTTTSAPLPRTGAGSASEAEDSAQAAASAAQSILPAFGALSGSASAASASGGETIGLPASTLAGGAAARTGGSARTATGATRRLDGFTKGNAGGPNAAALSREGDLPTVKVKGMEDLFNGGSQALDKK